MSETSDERSGAGTGKQARGPVARFWPLAVLALGLGLFFALGLNRYATLDTLRDNREALSQWVAAHMALAILLYIVAYAVMVAFSLPGALAATLTGGFLFGTLVGGLATVVAATIGATILFIAAKTAFGDLLRAKAGPAIKRMEEGFRENAFSYLLVLRLVPLFPFFLVNLAPAFLGVTLPVFVAATFIGIIPGTFVFASLGNGLGAVFDAGRSPDLGLIKEPQVTLPLLALAVLALVPVLYRRLRRAR
ncbi:MAG: TVP38/TMEM64 family protein [Parvibaculum sp.]|uniref:TVP38/TMEM64 family protein n=1 Tax=Parvibaculum sp. TaxID=2024848 RepID=UPI0025EF6B00|nr:TVP38/TMEM64 family protein [Parvibaculum sp.]MCE9650985.1 TVP38/TMEM64 family protein [Parvibaculum sp.]